MIKINVLLVLLVLSTIGEAQVQKTSELYNTILEMDSLLFNVGFNTCDIQQFDNIVADEFHFYHDQGGLTESKTGFISGFKNKVCNVAYRAERRLEQESMEVFPLYKNGELYGAIQNGKHQFFAIESDAEKSLTSIAKFTHVWVVKDGLWQLAEGLSYDHQVPVLPIDSALLFVDTDETNRWLLQKQISALGIGYIEDGKVKETRVFGELEKGKPASQNTIWNVASLTKPVTALVALKLIERGDWELDEPIHNYYTDPDVSSDPFSKLITTRIILSHQTGFPNWRWNTADEKLAFQFEPGTQYQYSGEGYEYLRKALESKFGKSLDHMAKELVLDPIGMDDTHFFWSDEIEESRFAKWHDDTGGIHPTYKNTTACAADDLLTTIEDYTKFVAHILDGAGLSQELQRELSADQVRINDVKHFGLGWWVDEGISQDNAIAMVHGGDDIGVHTIAFIIPSSRQGLVIFTNSDNGMMVFQDVLLHFLGDLGQGILEVEMK